MQIKPTDIKISESPFWNTVKLQFEKKDFNEVSFLNLVKEIIHEYDVNEFSIIKFTTRLDYNFNPKTQNNDEVVVVSIKYLTIDLKKLHSRPEKEQIRFVLNHVGYSNDQIEKMEFISNSMETYWKVEISDSNFRFDPDEMYAEREYIASFYNQIKGILEFGLNVNFHYKSN